MTNQEYIEEVIREICIQCDWQVYWNIDRETQEVYAFMECNDLFDWAAADGERIYPEDIESIKECYKIDYVYGDTLWCCRKRGQRPQGAMYKHIPKEVWPLFDECGPERDIGFWNPKDKEGNYLYKKEMGFK